MVFLESEIYRHTLPGFWKLPLLCQIILRWRMYSLHLLSIPHTLQSILIISRQWNSWKAHMVPLPLFRTKQKALSAPHIKNTTVLSHAQIAVFYKFVPPVITLDILSISYRCFNLPVERIISESKLKKGQQIM